MFLKNLSAGSDISTHETKPFSNSVPRHPTALGHPDEPDRSAAHVSSQPQTVQEEDNEYKQTIIVFIAYAPSDKYYYTQLMNRINSTIYQLCKKGRKWSDLNIIIEPFDITTSLSMITDTAHSNDPLQPYQLVLWLLSSEFVGHPFCYSENLAPTILHQGYRRLLCILLHECFLDGYPFDTVPSECYLPTNQLPISSWEGKGGEHQAFNNITVKIVDAINKLLLRQ